MMFDTRVTFSIGLVTRYGEEIPRPEAVRFIAATLAAFGFDGFTVRDIEGYWRGNRERSIEVVLVFARSDSPKFCPGELARCFAIALSQEAVLYTVDNVKAGLTYVLPTNDEARG